MAGPAVDDRPPLVHLPGSLSIRHSDELHVTHALLVHRVDWAGHRPEAFVSTVGHAADGQSRG
jgi:hypothetical protein